VGQITISGTVAGQGFTGSMTRSPAGSISHVSSIGAGTSGVLSTRTDDDTGTITSNSHPFNDDDIVDIYWTGGMRYGMKVSSDAANTFVLGASVVGTGDVLPVQGTTVIVCLQETVNIDFDGDDCRLIAVTADGRASFDFQEGAGTSVKHIEIEAANEIIAWASDTSAANPLTGNAIGQVKVSSGTAAATAVKILVEYDSGG
jgi:hypothetical protein